MRPSRCLVGWTLDSYTGDPGLIPDAVDSYPFITIKPVQGTNDSSVVSKVSAAAYGYFRDDFQRRFVCKVSRRAPLINRGYYVRWRAVDHCIKLFLQVTAGCNRRQMLSLGAGFDSLYFRLHEEGVLEGVTVFEVDFPNVAQRKAALIRSDPQLKDWKPHLSHNSAGPLYASSEEYRLLGVDVREEGQVQQALSAAGFQWSCPTLLLSEVVLTYMETQESDRVIGWAASHLPESMFVMYEQIRPSDPFGRVMQSHFLKLNSALHALTSYPDLAAQRQRFLSKGWEQCECLDMNQFYLGLVDQQERSRVEALESFDEFEEWHQKCSHYFILTATRGSLATQALLSPPAATPIPPLNPQLAPVALRVFPLPGGGGDPGDPCHVEGLGMASALLEPHLLLVTGGFGRSGREAAVKVMVHDQGCWRLANVEVSADWGARLYHSMTAVPGWGALVFGGRSSPLKPFGDILRVTYDFGQRRESTAPSLTVNVALKEMECSGCLPQPRWRHTATLVRHKGQTLLFVFGGRTQLEPALADVHFLDVQTMHWTEVLVKGSPPIGRHSHSSVAYGDGAVMFGGLGAGGVPLGDTVLLKPTPEGFSWETLPVNPPVAPRYSHSAHVIGDKLVVVGGVWLQTEGVPGVAVIHLSTGASVEYDLDMASIPWPLMLHSFCSELLDPKRSEVMLIGGGGNCFSFGTHLNPRPVTVDLSPVLTQCASSVVVED
ncbi:tRNA wybutosine-synthesizing protein 4 [Engraulis encrasicolus]|uniref:tRNA wybutosine-synthesizing protein 4 n=1 Tax=Engraulis encrasicolus TaxID=184585 RepID=UPI002FD0BCAF